METSDIQNPFTNPQDPFADMWGKKQKDFKNKKDVVVPNMETIWQDKSQVKEPLKLF